MLGKTYRFDRPGDPIGWSFRIEDSLKPLRRKTVLMRDGVVIEERSQSYDDVPLSGSTTFDYPDHDLSIDFGPVSLLTYGLVVRQGETVVWRSTRKPFREAGKLDQAVDALEAKGEQIDAVAGTAEGRARAKRQKALRPSLYVDLAFGLVFFFVAREYGLVTAALTGAGATMVLFLINPFVRWDLLGGFAAFGAAMALLSAGLAWGFQDDLAVKLRGTIMALIGASLALFDAVVLKGGYLGRRMALYMEGIGDIEPRRASFALAGATLLIMAIDTPLAFLLTTEQWIWYNAFLDSLIAIPIVLGAMYLARSPQNK